MTVKATGIIATRRVLTNIEKFLASPKPIKAYCEGAIEIIQDKTEKGVDYKHRKFESYSQAYAKRKGSSFVNLEVTGRMLSSIIFKVLNPGHAKIFISGGRAIVGGVHSQGTRKMPQREFMNISDSTDKKLGKKHFDDPMIKIIGRK